MTLSNYMGFSECVGVITSDTKQVGEFLGQTIKLADKGNKITQLSSSLIIVSSGYQYLSDFVFEKLQAAKPENLEDVYEELKRIKPEVKDFFVLNSCGRTEDFMSMFIMGINEKEALNVIAYTFSGGEVELLFENKPYGAPYAFSALPSDKHLDKIFSNIGQLKLTNQNDFRIIALDITNYLLDLQREFFKIDPSTVSETLCYYAIYKDIKLNQYIHKSGKVNIFSGDIEF